MRILREANHKFPKSYKIMERLANALVSFYCRKGDKEYDEIFELCNRILTECTDSIIRYKAIDTLGTAYGYAGKTEEMLKLAEQMPRSHFSYENFMLYHWQGDSDFAKRQEYMFYLINQLLATIDCLSEHRHDDNKMIYSPEEVISLRKLQIDLLELLYPDKDYQYTAQYGVIACRHLVNIFLQNNDLENAWHWLYKGADFAIHMDTYNFDSFHTSLILRNYSDGGWIMEAGGNHSQLILEWLTADEKSQALRSDPRLKVLVNRLKKVAKKP